jgi:hypothetical protein
MVELDSDIRGDAIFLASENTLDPQPIAVQADPIATGFRGQPRTSTLIIGSLPGEETRHVAEKLERQRPRTPNSPA